MVKLFVALHHSGSLYHMDKIHALLLDRRFIHILLYIQIIYYIRYRYLGGSFRSDWRIVSSAACLWNHLACLPLRRRPPLCLAMFDLAWLGEDIGRKWHRLTRVKSTVYDVAIASGLALWHHQYHQSHWVKTLSISAYINPLNLVNPPTESRIIVGFSSPL